MTKIPFDIKYRPQIESGRYKVETRDGRSARIVCWDRKASANTIVALVDSGTTETIMAYSLNGCFYGQTTKENTDLFIIPVERYKPTNSTNLGKRV